MATTKITKILFRRGSDFDRRPTILDEGEPGWVTDTCRLFVGDGRSAGGFPAVNVRTTINAPLHPNTGELVYEPIGDVTGAAQPAGQEVLAINHAALSGAISRWADTRYQTKANNITLSNLNSDSLSAYDTKFFISNVTTLSARNCTIETLTLRNKLSVESGGTGDDGASVSNWNDAYSWGDHKDAGYLFAADAPMYVNKVDEMYNTWGDHREAGYGFVTSLDTARAGGSDLLGSINFELPAGDDATSDIITAQAGSILRRLNTNNSLKIGSPASGSTVLLGQGLALNHVTAATSTWSDEMVHVAGGRAIKLHTYVDGNVNDASHKELVFQNGTLSVDSIAATTKNFEIDHPFYPDKKLVHACLEGPENGVYVRGKQREKIIWLPDYWKSLVDVDSVTVSITPVGGPGSYWIENVCDDRIEIGSDRDGGEFHYHVYGKRTDVPDLQITKDK